MKSRVRRIGALIIGVFIASVLLFSLHQLSSTEAAPPTFAPVSSITLSSTTALAGGCSPACNPDHDTVFNVPLGDVNFAGSGAALVTFLPGQWCIATHLKDCSSTTMAGDPDGPPVPVGTIVGSNQSNTKLALQSAGSNSECQLSTFVSFTKFMEAVPNADAGTIPPGTTGNNLLPLILDGANHNGIPAGAELWPTFNSLLLDPDGDPNTSNTIFPLARYIGVTNVNTTAVFLQTLIFAPDALRGFEGAPWDSFGLALGHPVLTILQDPTQSNNQIIADFCTNLDSLAVTKGTTLPNTTACLMTPVQIVGGDCHTVGADGHNEASIAGGSVLHENDTAASGIGNTGTHIYRLVAQGGRDFDQDGFEQGLDTCATLPNLDGDPRFNDGLDKDGLDSACDPDPSAQDNPPTCDGGCNRDQDGDGWFNRLDNCPLVANAASDEGSVVGNFDEDVELGTAVPDGGSPNDGIGDFCEPDYNGNSVADPEEAGLSDAVANGGYLSAVVKAFACNGASDADTDGWCKVREDGTGTSNMIDCAVTAGPNNDTVSDAGVPVDFNDDRAVNILDRALVVSEILAGTDGARFDLNTDGFVNILDRAATVASNGWTCSP